MSDESGSDRYLVISSDCHAGLPNAEYREWLDPAYRDRFDQHLADRTRMMELASRGVLNEEFAEEWERENGALTAPEFRPSINAATELAWQRRVQWSTLLEPKPVRTSFWNR